MVFKPKTKPSTLRRRLLLTDGHSSHLTARFIAFCLEKAIDLVVLPPHSSHILQPLDVAVFSPLKTYLSNETDRLARLNLSRISKIEWTAAFIEARRRAFSSSNICAGFRKAGIYPPSPIEVLASLNLLEPTPDPDTPP